MTRGGSACSQFQHVEASPGGLGVKSQHGLHGEPVSQEQQGKQDRGNKT